VNAARLYGINPETALELTNRKFLQRFNFLEREVRKSGRSLDDLTLQEMDEIWEKAKSIG
jgi:XTP/dITP diphosphohydrolase